MNQAYSLSIPLVVHSLKPQKGLFQPRDKREAIWGLELSYLSVICTLMYLANCTKPNITFTVKLLPRFHTKLTKRHWNGVKHVMCYF